MSGKVVLVGAGPGDPGLFTVKGRSVLSRAEVVVYDRLVGDGILDLIPPDAQRINVGKEPSHHPIPQDEINKILLEKAQEGKFVVRLKGGDPFLFGRGGEELELLVKHGIPFEVVPGVTSALSVPSYGGIPVTHRDCASSLHIITGHARAGKSIEINFDALVRTGGTMVFLMGVTALGEICTGLLEAGINPQTPAAIVERGTTPRQRRISGTVGTLFALAREHKVENPAISIIGDVCALADDFDWFDKLPLKGKRIVVTRPKERIGTLSARLRALGADVVEYPCIETVPILPNNELGQVLKEIENYEWLAFTSAAGVETLAAYLRENKLDIRCLGRVKLAAIGPATAEALGSLGLYVDYIPQVYDAEHLGEGLGSVAKGRVLILRAKEGSPMLNSELEKAEVSYRDIPIYETCYRNLDASKEEIACADYVTFTSASTVKGFVGAVGKDFDLSKITGLCIGEQTAAEAKNHGIKAIVARQATIDSMIEKLLQEN